MSGKTCAIRREFPREILNTDMLSHAKDSAKHELGRLLIEELSQNQGKSFVIRMGEEYFETSPMRYDMLTYEARIVIDDVKEKVIYHYESKTIPQQIKELIVQWYTWKVLKFKRKVVRPIVDFWYSIPSRVYNVCLEGSRGFYRELLS